jgi:hypothetical protein
MCMYPVQATTLLIIYAANDYSGELEAGIAIMRFAATPDCMSMQGSALGAGAAAT